MSTKIGLNRLIAQQTTERGNSEKQKKKDKAKVSEPKIKM